jgi:hypothetical protein
LAGWKKRDENCNNSLFFFSSSSCLWVMAHGMSTKVIKLDIINSKH